jgi:hypothetical protein
MPSRKQRRRRQKDRRHDYEYVYVDEEGHELELEEVEPDVAQQNGAARKRDAGQQRDSGSKPRRAGAAQTRGGKTIQRPTWSRVLKRAGLFAPLMFAFIYLLDRDIGLAAVLLVTAQMLVIFLPLSYLMDRMLYRRSQRQAEASQPQRRRT